MKRFKVFNLLSKNRLKATDLLDSKLYDERRFYTIFVKDLKQCRHEVIIESPYLTCRRVDEFIPLFKKLVKKGVKVRINTRHPYYHDEYLRIQAWLVLKKFKTAGVKVKLCRDYRHRKIAVLDRTILWEGSLNILSQNNSREVMRRTNSQPLCKQMINFTGLNRLYW